MEDTPPGDAPPGIPSAGGGYKELGNEAFQAGRYLQAIDLYTLAIDTGPPTAALYSNRAAAHLKCESYGSALQDAGVAIKLDPTFIKAYYRRGCTMLAMGKLLEAKADFQRLVKANPNNKDVVAQLRECDSLIRAKLEEAYRRVEEDAGVGGGMGGGAGGGAMGGGGGLYGPGGGLHPLAPIPPHLEPDSVPLPKDYKGPVLPRVPEGEGSSSSSGGSGSGSGGASAEACAADPNAVNAHGMSLAFVRALKAEFKSQRLLAKRYTWELLIRLRALLTTYSPLVKADFPPAAPAFNVCGDTHGQYYDTCNIFENISGEPSPTNPYLFNGDFCDRGSWGVENVLLLFAWKLLYPNHVHLTRGNHETRLQNKVYGFEGEVKHKYCMRTMDLFTAVFQSLPLAAIITSTGGGEGGSGSGSSASGSASGGLSSSSSSSSSGSGGRVMVTHGGLFTTDGVKLSDIEGINRYQEPSEEGGLMSDLLWSDPQPFPGRAPSKRGVGQSFGPDITRAFLEGNDLALLIRSHEVKDEGYVVEHGGKCITVFSAPNYCDTIGNKGAVCVLNHKDLGTPTFLQFTAVPHPPIRPMAYSSGYASLFGM